MYMQDLTFDARFVNETQALWYAHGQRDAGIGAHVDPMRFAKCYAEAKDEATRCQHCAMPDIQTAWKQFLQTGTIWKALVADIALLS